MKDNIKNINLTPITFEECVSVEGGGFFSDLGYYLGYGTRKLYESMLENSDKVRSVGIGAPV